MRGQQEGSGLHNFRAGLVIDKPQNNLGLYGVLILKYLLLRKKPACRKIASTELRLPPSIQKDVTDLSWFLFRKKLECTYH